MNIRQLVEIEVVRRYEASLALLVKMMVPCELVWSTVSNKASINPHESKMRSGSYWKKELVKDLPIYQNKRIGHSAIFMRLGSDGIITNISIWKINLNRSDSLLKDD